MKVITILGTRPEIIRLSRVMANLDKVCEHVIVHTGQNYDHELNQVFFDDLQVRSPDYFLGVDTTSLGACLGGILIESEKVFIKERPDAVLVLGDTNSSIAALMAKRMKIPVYHMEAGNRSFDANVPEEINRKMADHLSDYNLVYTEHARRHLLSEGLPHRHIYLTGSPMREVLDWAKERIEAANILDELMLERNEYILISVHREENVDNPENLSKVVNCLKAVEEKYKLPVVFSCHPRTRSRLESTGLFEVLENSGDIRILKPFGFHDYNQLQMASYCTVSDSGTISEESAILEFPAVTIRKSIERPEALDAGTIALTGLEPKDLILGIEVATGGIGNFERGADSVPEEYKITNTSERVIKLITGTSKLTRFWRNMEEFSRYDWT